MKIPSNLKLMAIFVLEDFNEFLVCASDKHSDLSKKDKLGNKKLIKKQNLILKKLYENKELNKNDCYLIGSANNIKVNDMEKKAMDLQKWLNEKTSINTLGVVE